MYSALSARNFSLNLLIEHDNFTSPFSRLHIHGSWCGAAFHTGARPGRVGCCIFFHAVDPHHAVITEGRTAPYCATSAGRRHPPRAHHRRPHSRDDRPLAVENVEVSLHRRVLTVSNGQRRTTSESTIGQPRQPADECRDQPPTPSTTTAAPHGLLGQAYDRDTRGQRPARRLLAPDDGRPAASRTGVGGDVTTRAKAEGVIEGRLDDYRGPTATTFRFALLTRRRPRAKCERARWLTGRRHAHAHPAAESWG